MSQHIYLLDSSIWIRVLRAALPPAMGDRVTALLGRRIVAINGVIKLEILSGARTEKEFRDYSARFDALHQFEIRAETWSRAGRLGYDLRRRGLTGSTVDLIIAASAIEHDAVLLHADADFDRIADNSGLQTESFVAA